MTTANSLYDLASYGLPSEAELEKLAARYFPELTPFESEASGADLKTYAPKALGDYEKESAYVSKPSRYGAVGARNIDSIRADFPILNQRLGANQLVWFDNAATTQKPQSVIDRLSYFYAYENSNIHRAAHDLAARATDAYEEARLKTARFLGAPSAESIAFVRGSTEGINLVARSFVKPKLKEGDEIVLTVLEHHANIVPWQIIAQETGALLRVAPVDESGQIILSQYAKLFNSRTKFAAFTHVSNALGTIVPIEALVSIAHSYGVKTLIDAAQSVSHIPLNVAALDADFLVFSGHKIYAPTGIGALYGKRELLEEADVYQGGGNMIADVTFERTIYQKPPAKFEAGTGSIADAAGLGAALDYVSSIGLENIFAYEHALLEYGARELKTVRGLRLIGTADHKTSILSFVIDGFSNERVGKFLNSKGIAVRSGHHCAQPALRNFGLEGSVRPSIAFYNTFEEIDYLIESLRELTRTF
ncbi:MAG: cysteine desulfurase [Helicobacteraceae bacterium]|jgi:cysteine desulfurase/selenocysteine lyase|nr:cysteine desulfurase [Helicobacteraceae bacterium]